MLQLVSKKRHQRCRKHRGFGLGLFGTTGSGTSGDRKYAGRGKYIGRTLRSPMQRSQSTPELGNPRRLWLSGSRDVKVRPRSIQNSDHCLLRRLLKKASSRSPHSSQRRLTTQFKNTVKYPPSCIIVLYRKLKLFYPSRTFLWTPTTYLRINEINLHLRCSLFLAS